MAVTAPRLNCSVLQRTASAYFFVNPQSTVQDKMADARLSDKELAAINAAAVTREYRVKPHLGESMCIKSIPARS